MPEVRVRPFLASGIVYLALGAVGAVAVALGADAPSGLAAWILMAGWIAPSWLGTAYWYFAPFAKREVVSGRAALVGLALVHAALVAYATATFVWGPGAALRAYLAVAGLGLLVSAGVMLWSTWRGPEWRGGVPAWRRGGTHAASDRVAAGLAAGALLQLAVAGVLLMAVPPRGQGIAHFVVLALGFGAQAYGAFAFLLLPRNVKRPLSRPAAALAGVLAVAGNVGLLALTAAFLRPVAFPFFLPASVPVAAAVLALGLFLAFEPWRARPGSVSHLLAAARPWLGASAAALVLAAALLPLAFTDALPLEALGLGAPLLLAGVGLAHAGVAVLAWPVLLNATPASRRWGFVGAAVAVLGVASLLLEAVPVALGLFAVAAAAHVVQVAPMRTPRRECPPPEDVDASPGGERSR